MSQRVAAHAQCHTKPFTILDSGDGDLVQSAECALTQRMPVLSPRGGQEPLIPTIYNPSAQSPLLDSYSVPLIQDTTILNGDSHEPLRTSTLVEVGAKGFSSESAQAITVDIPTTESEDNSLPADKSSSKCQPGVIHRYWEILISTFNRLFISAPQEDASTHQINQFIEKSSQLVWREYPLLHRYCVSTGLCAEPIDDRISRAEEDSLWKNEPTVSTDEPDEERILPTVPDYVLAYAPYVHLFSGEEYWPCDIAQHLLHTTPYLNYTPARAQHDHEKLSTLDDLNKWGHYVYLTSNDNVVEQPEWLTGKSNIPESRPQCKSGIKEMYGSHGDDNNPAGPCGQKKLGYSDAPATLIVVEKGDGVVDAFWFFFYSFNKGNKVLNVRFGNHIGDWEHTTVRFINGEPTSVFLSEHDFGDAYTYDAVEKKGERPVVYSAVGSHAMYATPGVHPYVLPFGLLHDVTDRGPIWDPTLNLYAFTYNITSETISQTDKSPHVPTAWFDFIGYWGDKHYPLDDPRQYAFAGQYHYGSGPLGPKFKRLANEHICEHEGDCVVWNSLEEGAARVRFSMGLGLREGEEDDDDDKDKGPDSGPFATGSETDELEL